MGAEPRFPCCQERKRETSATVLSHLLLTLVTHCLRGARTEQLLKECVTVHPHLCSQAGAEPTCESDTLLGTGHVVLSKETVSPSRKPQFNEVDRLMKTGSQYNVMNVKEGLTMGPWYIELRFSECGKKEAGWTFWKRRLIKQKTEDCSMQGER